MDWGKAISNLEHANAAVTGCAADDLTTLESAMADRDKAIQAIAVLDPYTLNLTLANRLRAAFDRGAAIRAKLASIYRNSDTGLRRTRCIHQFFEAGPH